MGMFEIGLALIAVISPLIGHKRLSETVVWEYTLNENIESVIAINDFFISLASFRQHLNIRQ